MIKKIIIAVVLLAAIIAGGTGCMANKQNNDTQNNVSANELALAYMEEKYGEPFAFAAPCGDSMTGTRSLLVTCNSLPDQRILVEVENFRTDDKIFRDNYLAVKYEAETIDFIRACVSASYSDFNFFYEAPYACQAAGLPADASFEEFLADGNAELSVMIELKSSEFTGTEGLNEIVAEISNSCKNMTITVVVVDDSVFGTLDRASLNNRIAHRDYIARAKVYIDHDNIEIDWRGEGIANG